MAFIVAVPLDAAPVTVKLGSVKPSAVSVAVKMLLEKKVERVITTKYYKVETSKDIIGIEVLSAIKNLYAMLIGASLGLSGPNIQRNIRNKYYHNTSSSLFRESLLEMKNFTVKMNGLQETTYGLAGLGDLYVSVAGGRNSKMGYYLGCLLYTSPSPRDRTRSRMPSSA